MSRCRGCVDLPSRLTRSLERYFRKLVGNTDIEDSVQRLDNLTQEEARMASAELLKVTHGIDGKVEDVHGEVQDIGGVVNDISSEVREVNRGCLFNPCSSFRGFRQLRRESAQRQPFTMAFSLRSVHQS